MNIELKPIAESKVRQLGGDVCGVLVRNEAGAWAAVSEGGRVMWLDDFEPVPVARNEDVALPSHATKSDLIDCIDLMADEFKRIKALNPGDEILDLCDRALRVTEQNVPVLEVRDRLQKTVSKLLWKVSDLEDQLEAARAQSGQGVEPVAWVAPTATGIFYGETAEEAAANAESFGATLAGTIPLYTHPQPAQQGSVPEGWKLVPVEPTTEMRYAYHEAYQRYLEGSIPSPDGQWWAMLDAAPQPEGDGWVSSFERAPTKSDADFSDRVIWWEATDDTLQEFIPVVAHYDPNWWEGGYFEDFRKDIAPSHPFWKPTGLKRPQPPQEDER